jgi:serine/threonine-protein kinase
MNANICGDDSLELILNDQADHPDFDVVVNHLSQCGHCQKRLDDLAARPSWWHETREHLRHCVTAEVPELPAAEALVAARLDTTPKALSSDVQSLLEPSRHPEWLGRIGKYEIECEIGRGGMGIVLKGFDSELARPVAVKLLAPHLASSGTARQRFIREARAAAVVHENVVAIYGIQTHGALPSIVMPYISGVSLQHYIDEHGAPDAVDVVRIGIQIASGLAAAHDQGLVHRDIKPANVILENGINRVQITDFGLARAAHDADLTHTGIIAGTPAFMSPEQSLRESIDHRSDLFSLGSVLYYSATGRLPFRASTPIGVLQQVCNATPTRLCEENPQVPDRLEAVIEKLLAKQPHERFENATSLKIYLTEYLAHLQQPATAHPPRKLVTPSSRARARRIWRRVGFAAGLPLIAGAIVLILSAVSPDPAVRSDPGPRMEPSEHPFDPGQIAAAVASVASTAEIDAEIQAIALAVSAVEHRNTVAPISNDHFDRIVDALSGELAGTETSRLRLDDFADLELRSSMTTEIRSVSDELQRLEQSVDIQ